MRRGLLLAALLLGLAPAAGATEVLKIYGPGGPAPAMKAAAAAFGKDQGVQVDVQAGPTAQWLDAAKQSGDLVYSGSEAMMSDFLIALDGTLAPETVEPLYLRPAAILVRPGNPRKIRGFSDLLKTGMQVMVVHGAGQVGMWEDIAGRSGDIDTVRAFRHNIVAYAPNSAAAKQRWQDDSGIDAWIIYNIWSIANPGLADIVPLEPQYRVYRDCGVVLTHRGQDRPLAKAFVDFLKSPKGRAIFLQYGWSDHDHVSNQ